MIEWKIICAAPCGIPDLGLSLHRGQEIWISADRALASKDLQIARNQGQVRISKQSRRHEGKTPRHVPPFVSLSQRHRQDVPTIHVVENGTPSTLPEPNTQEVVQKIKEEILGDIRSTVAAEIQKALEKAPQHEGGVSASQLEAVLEGVLRRVGPVAPGNTPAQTRVVSEDPLYLPSKLVDSEAKTKISLKKTETEDSDGLLDETVANLKKLRKTLG